MAPPPDVLRFALRELREQKATAALRSAALTCKVWRPLAQEALYSAFTVRIRIADDILQYLEFFGNTASIAALVTRLSIRPNARPAAIRARVGLTAHELQALLRCFPNLSTLLLEHTTPCGIAANNH